MEILKWEDARDWDGPTMAKLDAEVRRLTEENGRLKEQGGTCRLEGVTDAAFRVWDGENRLVEDFASISECSNCGALILEPPAYTRAFSLDDDALWPEYRFCPVCRSAVEVMR